MPLSIVIGHVFLTAKIDILKITLNYMRLLVFLVIYAIVSVMFMRLENIPAFEFLHGALRLREQFSVFLSLWSGFPHALWWSLEGQIGVGILVDK